MSNLEIVIWVGLHRPPVAMRDPAQRGRSKSVELPIASTVIAVLLLIAWLSPSLIAFLFLAACASGVYAMATALLARRDAER